MRLFWLVLSLTAVSFGGGQTLLAGLERELVQTGQLDPQSFAGAVALGQSTPGPLAAFTTAIGLSVGGWSGAVAATLAMLAVSLVVACLIQRLPASVTQIPFIRAGLAEMPVVGLAFMLFLAGRLLLSGPDTVSLLGLIVIALVIVGKMAKLPPAALLACALLVSVAAG